MINIKQSGNTRVRHIKISVFARLCFPLQLHQLGLLTQFLTPYLNTARTFNNSIISPPQLFPMLSAFFIRVPCSLALYPAWRIQKSTITFHNRKSITSFFLVPSSFLSQHTLFITNYSLFIHILLPLSTSHIVS